MFTARLQVRVCDNGESVGMSYVYTASVPLRWSVAGVTRESVTTAGRDNEAVRSAWSDCWGPSTHGYSNHVMVVAGRVIMEGATRHHHCVAVSRYINTINDRRLLYLRQAGLQPCMFGCSAGYILPKPGCWFHYYAANEAWIRGPPTSAKKLADLSPRLTADRSSLAVLIGCPS